MAKIPAFQFYPGDWRKDPGVQALNFHDRGVWFEILCLMHESEDRGKLLLNGKPMPLKVLARLLGLDLSVLTNTIDTLLEYGVASKEADSEVIYNRRMVKDEYIRKIRAEAGKKGGDASLLKQKGEQNPSKLLSKIEANSEAKFEQISEDEDEDIFSFKGDARGNLSLKEKILSHTQYWQAQKKNYHLPDFDASLQEWSDRNMLTKFDDDNHIRRSFSKFLEDKHLKLLKSGGKPLAEPTKPRTPTRQVGNLEALTILPPNGSH